MIHKLLAWLFNLIFFLHGKNLLWNQQNATTPDYDNVEFVSREGWGARPAVGFTNLSTPVNMVFIHHTAWTSCYNKSECIANVKKVQDFHMDDRGWWDIGYSFLVGEDGRVYVGRGWDRQGAHTKGYNQYSVGISIMGDFMESLPNDKALDSVKAAIQYGIEQDYISPDYELFGHRDGRCTECPGDALFAEIQTWEHYSHRNLTIIC